MAHHINNDAITIIDNASGKRFKVSAKNKAGGTKNVTVHSIKKNFAPMLKVSSPDELLVFPSVAASNGGGAAEVMDDRHGALEDAVLLMAGDTYYLHKRSDEEEEGINNEYVRSSYTSRSPSTSNNRVVANPPSSSYHQDPTQSMATDSSSRQQQSQPQVRSRSRSSGTSQPGGTSSREALLSRARDLVRVKEDLLQELDEISMALEHDQNVENGDPHDSYLSPPRRDSAVPMTNNRRGSPTHSSRGHGGGHRHESPSSNNTHHPSSHVGEAAEDDELLTAQINEVEYQITVVESLLDEDGATWKKELTELEVEIRSAKEQALDALDAETRENNLEANKIQDDIDTLSRELDALRKDLQYSNEEVQAERRQVERATSNLEKSKRSVLQLLENFGSTDEKDFEMAEYLAHTSAQKHALSLKLEHIADENGQLRAEYERISRDRKMLHKQIEDLKGNIRVVVRQRPVLSSDESAPHHVTHFEEGAIEANEHHQSIFVSSPTTGLRNYEFYAVYAPCEDSVRQQGTLFEEQVVPLLDSVFDGNNSCVIAYGQTGSGKTFTIVGETPEGHLTGLLPQSVEYLFDPSRNTRFSQDGSHEEHVSTVSMTMIELYMDTILDLVPLVTSTATTSAKKCDIRQLPGMDGVSIVGAEEVTLHSWEHAMDLIQKGIKARQTHRTLRNPVSSRSHLILTVNVTTSDGHRSRLMFVDLAGSERVSRSLSQGERLKEAQHINKSLSALGDVVASLTSGGTGTKQAHIPYRNSKLTQILQNCIGGNSKTLMVTCICPHIPHQHNLMETLSTLKFASRAKLVRNNIALRRPASHKEILSRNTSTVVGDGGEGRGGTTNDNEQPNNGDDFGEDVAALTSTVGGMTNNTDEDDEEVEDDRQQYMRRAPPPPPAERQHHHQQYRGGVVSSRSGSDVTGGGYHVHHHNNDNNGEHLVDNGVEAILE